MSAKYTRTHYNYQKQLGHLWINNDTTRIVAENLKQGIPSSRIVEVVRDTGTAEGIGRKDLISEKDVNNIKKQFNIDGIQKHTNDLVSVATIVEEIQVSKYNAILLFKQQGEEPCEECYLFDTHDFLLVLQTQCQRDMLIRHGCKGVCMDATYNINELNYCNLLDEYQEGVPVAWALCNHRELASSKKVPQHFGRVERCLSSTMCARDGDQKGVISSITN